MHSFEYSHEYCNPTKFGQDWTEMQDWTQCKILVGPIFSKDRSVPIASTAKNDNSHNLSN